MACEGVRPGGVVLAYGKPCPLRGTLDARLTMKPLIVIGTEDAEFYLLLDHVLQMEGFRCILASGIDEVLSASVARAPAGVILDCRPEFFSAAEAFHRLKGKAETNSIPVFALISPGAEIDHVELIKAGVDDAFTRPFAPSKMVERIRAVLADGKGADALVGREALSYADVEMDLASHRVHRNGREVQLGPIEYKLLQHLLRSPEKVFSRKELIDAAWPRNVYVGPRTVDVHVGHLRKALNSGTNRDLIRTVRTAGYALTAGRTGDAPKGD